MKIFPAKNLGSRKDRIQSRLLILASLLLLTYAIILTIAPAVRLHSGWESFQFKHWLGAIVWIVAFAFLHIQTKELLPNRDPYLLPIVSVLSGIGLMSIWRLYPNLGLRQSAWLAIGSVLVYGGLKFPHFLAYLRRYKYIWLVLGLILMGLTIILGTNPSGDGPTLWLRLFMVYFQPSEPLKLLLISFLAGYFSDRMITDRSSIKALLPSILVTGMALLLLFFQHDLGTALIFLFIFLAMFFSSLSKKWNLWVTLLIFVIAGGAAYLSSDVVKVRIDTWLNPFGDPAGKSYQIIQSMIAIAEGSLMGTGPGLGSPGLIPVAVSDFIFSAIAEETGFLGCTLIILLIALFIYRGICIASSSHKGFQRYLSSGLVFYFGFQSILIIGGNIGLLPLTGVTLPFVSYGGSSLIISFAALLILLTISQQAPKEIRKDLPKQRQMLWIGKAIIAILIIEILATSLLSFWFSPSLISRVDNPRWIIDDRFIERGRILDRDNRILVENAGNIGEYQRVINYTPLTPIIGYTNNIYGQTGLESSLFPYLRGYEGYPYGSQFWNALLYNQPLNGLDIRLTIDLDIQKTADQQLGDLVGAALLINAETGEILAMASHPYFAAANLEEEWESLMENKDAPLLNRITQGVYPAGTSLLPFMMTLQPDIIQQDSQPQSRFPDLTGDLLCVKQSFEDTIWQALIANGCQRAQEAIGGLTGITALLNLYDDLGFYIEPKIRLEVAQADTRDVNDETLFLKGEQAVNISPLQMALAASALTNQGMIPAPRIVNDVQDSEGNWETLPNLGNQIQALSSEAALMISSLLQVDDSAYWQLSAWAQTDDNELITWYLAGTTMNWQRQPLVVVVVLESDNPDAAQSIGSILIEQAMR